MSEPEEQEPAPPPPPKKGGLMTGQVLLTLIGTAGALVFAWAGLEMRGIASVGGNTIDEAFYQTMGTFSWGMAFLLLVVSWGIAGLLGKHD